MSTTQQIKTNNTKPSNAPVKTSALQNFQVHLEYDKNLRDIRQQIRARTI